MRSAYSNWSQMRAWHIADNENKINPTWMGSTTEMNTLRGGVFSRFVPSMGSCSQCCLILHPHRVAVPFPPTFASPWRNSFVQIHCGTTFLKANSGTTAQQRPKHSWVRLKKRLGSSIGVVLWYNYGKITPRWGNHRFPMSIYMHIYIHIYIHIYTYMYVYMCTYSASSTICLYIHIWWKTVDTAPSYT